MPFGNNKQKLGIFGLLSVMAAPRELLKVELRFAPLLIL